MQDKCHLIKSHQALNGLRVSSCPTPHKHEVQVSLQEVKSGQALTGIEEEAHSLRLPLVTLQLPTTCSSYGAQHSFFHCLPRKG